MNQTAAQSIAVTEQDFDSQVLQSDTPVLVDFWAEWCAPCRALGPVIESLATDYGDRAKIVKVDIDSNPSIASRFGIRSIPTVMLFQDGTLVDTFVGVRPKHDYAGAIDKLA